MAKEIELKLALSPHHVGALLQQPLFQQPDIQPAGKQRLRNCYFDTADQALQAARIALRIRQTETQIIQTLKTRGHSQGGLHERNEWEWTLPQATLDFSLLADTAWPEVLAEPPSPEQLQPAFNTDFERQLWHYRSLNAAGEPVEVEIALDSGEVWLELDGERRSDPISELELELKQGQPGDLFDLALQLANAVPLQISDISKAERGYRLFAPEQYQLRLERPQLSADTALEEAYVKLLQFELLSWPRQLEAWQYSRKWDHGVQALESLRNIRALREHFADVAPLPSDDELGRLIDKLIDRLLSLLGWQRCSQLLGPHAVEWTRNQAEQAGVRLEVLTQTREAGLIALLLGEKLSKRPWRDRWNEQHQQRAIQPLRQHTPDRP
ncbi:MAG: CYTH domain-containing protein [Marinobacterium sp.]|nr:CYTH domain-containing protein [Marinobacterium sp.]